MPDIKVELTADEFARLQRIAARSGISLEQLVADELRARYTLDRHVAKVIDIQRSKATPGDANSG